MVDNMHSRTGGNNVQDLMKLGSRGKVVTCYIQRDKERFTLWEGPPPKAGAKEEDGKFLLAALKSEYMVGTEYIISSNPKLSKENSNIDVIGVVDSKFSWSLTPKFILYRTNGCHHTGAVPLIKTTTSGRHDSSKIFAPGVLDAGCFTKVGDVSHELPLVRPASIECSLLLACPLGGPISMENSLPRARAYFRDFNGSAPTPTERFNKDDSTPVLQGFEDSRQGISVELGDCAGADFQSTSCDIDMLLMPMLLSSKGTSWSRIMRFFPRGDVDVIRCRKNQQPVLVPVLKPNQYLLQIAQCGTSWDLYSVHYRFPLSKFQAFAIALTIFGP